MWELDKYLLNDYWMLASQIHSLQSIPLALTSLRSCRLVISSYLLDSPQWISHQHPIHNIAKLISLAFHLWRGNTTSGLRAWSLGYWFELQLLYYMAEWPWGSLLTLYPCMREYKVVLRIQWDNGDKAFNTVPAHSNCCLLPIVIISPKYPIFLIW